MPSEKSDLDLVLLFQEGRQEAFDELVRRHMRKAVQIAYVACGNYEDAKDVSQEAFVKAYAALRGFERKAQFSTWFYRILMNAVKDFLRQKRWSRWVAWEDRKSMDTFFETLRDPAATADRGARTAELGERMSEAIRKLPFKQQWIFGMRFTGGLSIEEIAQATGLREGTVKATLHFAMQKFKDEMASYLRA